VAADAPESADLDALLAELRARVEARRRQGELPGELVETLDEHFERLVGGRPLPSPPVFEDLERAVDELENFEYSRGRIDAGSEIVGGDLVHRAVGKVVSRQVQGVLEQSQAHAHRIAHAVQLLTRLASTLSHEFDGKVVQQLEDLQVRVAEQQRTLNDLDRQLREVAARVPGIPLDAWYREDDFTAHFRGSADELRTRYRSLAERLVGCDPVIDIGFGRGEFLEMLGELGVRARGVEVDPNLVSTARGRGLDVAVGAGLEHLATLPDESLGGIVMIQVIEHLSPQQVVDSVKLCYEKLRPGGKLVIETVNPASLYIYARAFWVDPDHVRPVHGAFLEFLLQQAGFAVIERDERSPVPEDEVPQPVPGDDEQTKQINENFARINALLFGPQDYALIATR
jgi:SAM-dependent methyltransferase